MKLVGYIVLLLVLIANLYIMWNGIKISVQSGNISIEYELHPLKRLFIK
jgi:hypothetical protein